MTESLEFYAPSPRGTEALVAEELRGYLAAQRSAEVTPTVTALRETVRIKLAVSNPDYTASPD